MTKEHRLDEIEDFCNFLKAIYEKYLPQLSENVQITLFGFSQGTATQCRWIMRDFQNLTSSYYGRALPDDLDFRPHADYFNAKKLIFAYGESDPFLTEKRLPLVKGLMERSELKFEEFTFAGKHVVDREALKMLCQTFNI